MSKTAFVDREGLERKLASRLVQLQEEGVSDSFMNGVALALALVVNEPKIDPSVAVRWDEISPVVCRSCHGFGLEGWKFCPECGGKYETD